MTKPNLSRRLPPLLALSLLLGACSQAPSTPTTSAPTTTTAPVSSPAEAHLGLGEAGVLPGGAPINQDASRNARLGPVTVPPGKGLSAQAFWGDLTSLVQLRVLVLHTGTGDFGLSTARALLRQNGIPFTEVDTTATTLTPEQLRSSLGVGLYSGVVLTSSALTVQDSSGAYVSALNADEWNTLFAYERAFRVRQLALFGYPQATPEDYGLRAVPGTESASTDVTVTPEGRSVFPDLTASALPIRNAFNYPTQLTPVPGVSTTPLLRDQAGNILAATSTAPDGRERLILTAAENPNLLHTQLLGYGLMQWLTRGVHLGEYRRFLQVDVDDWFSASDVFDPATGQVRPGAYRFGAQDAVSLRDQQSAIRAEFPLARNFRLAQAFNGFRADPAAPNTCAPDSTVKDALSAVTKCVAGSFDWVNHTRDHFLMDTMSYADSLMEIQTNFEIAAQLGLPVSRQAFVTPEHSGLGWYSPAPGTPKQDFGLQAGNAEMLRAAQDAGIRYVASNHSVLSQWNPECPNCGVTSPLNPNVLLVPRWPNNVGYDTTTPAEAAGRYNAVYGPRGTAPYHDHDLSYEEFLGSESRLGVLHILNGTAWPTYMHVGNQREYAPGRSLVTDWVRAVLSDYSRYSTLPLNTLKWDDLGAYVAGRTAYEKDKEQIVATWDRNTNLVTVRYLGPWNRAATMYLTGTNSTQGSTTTYGGRNLTRMKVGALGALLPVQPR